MVNPWSCEVMDDYLIKKSFPFILFNLSENTVSAWSYGKINYFMGNGKLVRKSEQMESSERTNQKHSGNL